MQAKPGQIAGEPHGPGLPYFAVAPASRPPLLPTKKVGATSTTDVAILALKTSGSPAEPWRTVPRP